MVLPRHTIENTGMASAALTIPHRAHAIRPLARDPEYRRPLETTRPSEVDRPSAAFSGRVEKPVPYPTVLIATVSPEMRMWLSCSLKQDDYLLLEAQSDSEVLQVARCHSRPIQVLLLQNHLVDDSLLKVLERMRPDAQVVIVEDESGQGGLPAALALAKVRQLLESIQQMTITR